MSHVTGAELDALRAAVEADLPRFLRELEHLVDIDSGSYTKAGVDEVATWMAESLAGLGARIERIPSADLGDTIVATLGHGQAGPTVLVIGHTDTVFDPGTAAERPFAIRDGLATGPGVNDMKAGLLGGLYALRALRGVAGGSPSWLPVGQVVYVVNPDEEIGSPVSSPIIRSLAAGADVALVLECGRANGDIVSSRKGICDLELRIRGRAAHAGVEPEKGRSAVLEAAHEILALHALASRWPGVTVNAGVVHGGTRPNVVAEEALVQVDMRALTRATMEEAEAAIRAIAAHTTVPDTTCEVRELGRHWPMEKTARSGHLVEELVAIAGQLGFPLRDAATGGASDANTTAGLGVPTVDGLGPVGGDDHSPAEWTLVESIVPRVTLLAAFLLHLGRDPAVAAWRAERS